MLLCGSTPLRLSSAVRLFRPTSRLFVSFRPTGSPDRPSSFRKPTRQALRRTPRRTSWRLPDVRAPGGSQKKALQLASLEQQLGRRSNPLWSMNQLGGYSTNSSNTTGQLAMLKQVSQDPLFTPPHRQPGYSSNASFLLSRPNGQASRLSDDKANWHMRNLHERQRGLNRTAGKTLNANAFRRWYKDG